MPRAALDATLLQAALDAGATLTDGVYLGSSAGGSSMQILYRDGRGVDASLRARVLVGADGVWSAVAQRSHLCGRRDGRGRWALGGHVPEQRPSDELEMYVGEAGYYARNPLGGGMVNQMLIAPKPPADDQADRLVQEITGGRHRFAAETLERRLAVGPLRYAPARIGHGRTLLSGDAAGLLDPFTGQGVALALQLSRETAVAAKSILAGKNRRGAIGSYAAARRRALLPKRLLSVLVNVLLRTPALRSRALRRTRADGRTAELLLAVVCGAVPAGRALSARRLWKLLA